MTNKLLGQNWLINLKIHEQIVKAGEVLSPDIVLEIGPGTGLLTQPLAATGATILAVEKDLNLVGDLQRQFQSSKNVTIMAKDALKFDPVAHGLLVNGYKIVSNIPYYLTSHLLRTILEKWPRPQLMVFMLQKEVARRIVAKPPEMNLLALSVQFYAQARIIRLVSKGNFRPVPAVDSAIVKITPQELSPGQKFLAPVFFKITRAGFSGKRKQLANSLAAGSGLAKKKIETLLADASIESRRRPETLTIQEWLKLSSLFSSLSLAVLD